MKVAIIGGGPAGCAAAYYFHNVGCNEIVIYEQNDNLGGCSHTRFYDTIPYEFGPQILFTGKKWIQEFFSRWLVNKKPSFGNYQYLASVDGKLDNMHDFPVRASNVLKLDSPEKIIQELYELNLDRPDYSNLENYCISRVGETLYESYFKNYNRKAWGRDPKEIICDWVNFRPLSLAKQKGRFSGKWEGHPGNYNPLWEGLTQRAERISATVTVDENYLFYADGEQINADLILSTISMNDKLEFMDTCKVYVAIKCDKTLMQSCFNTFPNHYNFVRLFEYKLQYEAESEYTLIDFAFPSQCRSHIDAFIKEAKWFCRTILKREWEDLWVDYREKVYPVATQKSVGVFNQMLEDIRHIPVIPLGRAGMHAYISKDTCVRMARDASLALNRLLDPKTKVDAIQEIRKDLH